MLLALGLLPLALGLLALGLGLLALALMYGVVRPSETAQRLIEPESGNLLFAKYGFTAENVAAHARTALSRIG